MSLRSSPDETAVPSPAASPDQFNPAALLPDRWRSVLSDALSTPSFKTLSGFLAEEYAGETVFPPREDLFSAFHLTPFDSVKVVVLGQDPYHDDGQAHGLAFSVRPGVRFPPSLRNIFKELSGDTGLPAPIHGSLIPWAEQGVLAEYRADRPGARRGLAPESRMGRVHGPCDQGPERTGKAGDLRPVGSPRAEKTFADRRTETLRYHVAAPVAAVRAPRVLRQPAVFQGQ